MARGASDVTTGGTSARVLRAFVAELVAGGLRHVVICPGSRSLPMALALRAHPDLGILTHIDERAGAFLALGLARASRRPVAVLGTSGTAVVNFAPAVVEARHGRVPLIVLTADRPPELRDRGSAQTIDQGHLYGRAAKWYAELPVPDDRVPEAYVRDVAARAMAVAAGTPAGPVQVNLPFRAPLLPDGPLAPEPGDQASSHLGTRPGNLGLSEADHAAIDAAVEASRRPLIVVGPLDRPDVVPIIGRLSTTIGAPIIADGLSGMRSGDHDQSRLVARADLVLRSEAFRRAHAPDLVIRFGAAPTSAGTLGFLDACDAPRILVDDGTWDDPALRGGMFVRADPAIVAEAMVVADANGSVDAAWRGAWVAAGDRADAAVRATLATFDEPFEGAVFAALEGRLPPGTRLVVSSSMPVRDLDTFLPGGPGPLRCIANRGANGIDGVVSTALGVAAADRQPVLAVVGDLAFLHDANALIGARLNDLSLTMVVIDNDGGGIFSFLPQGEVDRPEIGLPEHYEQLFGTPHGMDVLAVARAFGATTVDLDPATIGEAITAALGRSGVQVLRLRTDRARNVVLHRQVQVAAITAVETNA